METSAIEVVRRYLSELGGVRTAHEVEVRGTVRCSVTFKYAGALIGAGLDEAACQADSGAMLEARQVLKDADCLRGGPRLQRFSDHVLPGSMKDGVSR